MFVGELSWDTSNIKAHTELKGRGKSPTFSVWKMKSAFNDEYAN